MGVRAAGGARERAGKPAEAGRDDERGLRCQHELMAWDACRRRTELTEANLQLGKSKGNPRDWGILKKRGRSKRRRTRKEW
ncbi:hypothetical protein NDU88_006523 [Pleurodeles waltl]|uniref:Uncharacterized protein n=1 Tax=Pleurodeles waltl TaxID=8319 RepID=A0AAV7PJZ7_PLEWA|nr:hypothetical protein NDU88_006523 [Pleurodeles waltl]